MRMTTKQRLSVAEAAWAVALRLQSFGYAEISAEMKISMDWATTIVRAWVSEGSAFYVSGGERGARKMFRVDGDFVRQLNRSAEDNMWTAMRKLRSFTPSEIAAHATTAQLAVPVEDAAAYCRVLLATEYLAVSRRAAPAMKREAIYRLINVTGVMAPMPTRVRAIRDPNTGRVIVLGDMA